MPSDLDFPGTGFTDLPAVAIGRGKNFALLLRLRPGHCGVVSLDRDGALSSFGVDAPTPGQPAVGAGGADLPAAIAAAIGPAQLASAQTGNGEVKQYCGSRGMVVQLPAVTQLSIEGAATVLGDPEAPLIVVGTPDVLTRATASPRAS